MSAVLKTSLDSVRKGVSTQANEGFLPEMEKVAFHADNNFGEGEESQRYLDY